MSARETFESIYSFDLDAAEKAIAAVEDFRKWQDITDARFAAWMKFERDERGKLVVHGNSIRRAEKARDARMYAAIDAVFAIRESAWYPTSTKVVEASNDVSSDESLAALKAYRDEIAAKIAAGREQS